MAPREALGRAKSAANESVKRLRDRRRKSRRRLEEIFDRKTFTSVAVMGSMGKLLEVSVVPLLDPSTAVDLWRVSAWGVVMVSAVVASIHWEHLANAAEAAADSVEEATEDGEG